MVTIQVIILLISLQKPGDLAEHCVKIGLNYSVAESTSCLTESSFRYSYSRSQGNYVMVINSTDYAGNNLITTLSTVHHTTLPNINSSIPNILKSGTNQSFSIQSLFETTADIDGMEIKFKIMEVGSKFLPV